MKEYVSHSLYPDLGKELLMFIQENSAIETFTHVTVILLILFDLWQGNKAGVRVKTRNGSIPGCTVDLRTISENDTQESGPYKMKTVRKLWERLL